MGRDGRDSRELNDLHVKSRVGTYDKKRGRVVLALRWNGAAVLCGDGDLSLYRDAWSAWPPIPH